MDRIRNWKSWRITWICKVEWLKIIKIRNTSSFELLYFPMNTHNLKNKLHTHLRCNIVLIFFFMNLNGWNIKSNICKAGDRQMWLHTGRERLYAQSSFEFLKWLEVNPPDASIRIRWHVAVSHPKWRGVSVPSQIQIPPFRTDNHTRHYHPEEEAE